MLLRLCAAAFSLFGIMVLAAAPAQAISDDVFIVPRVPVTATADSAAAAKSSAQSRGRRRAMDILLRRLTGEEDWPYLPQIAAGDSLDAGGGIVLTDQDLRDLESGFEVYSEKSSSTTYRAYITYRFKPAAVRRLLKDAGIAYSEAQTRTALVIPVLQTANGTYLWEQNNPWMAAWKVRPYNNELTPMIAPLGDLDDSSTVSARQALALNQAALGEMAVRYNVSQVIVASAYLQQVDGEDRLRVRLMNGYRESDGEAVLDELGPDGANDPIGENRLNQGPQSNTFITAEVGDVLAETWLKQESGNFPLLAEKSIEAAIGKYANPWKEQTLIDHSIASVLEVTAYYRSLRDWMKIRSALVATPLVGSVQVHSLSRGGAELLVRAYGDPSKLIIAMESQGLSLWTEDGEMWSISTPAMAPSVMRQSRRRADVNNYNSTPNRAVGAQPASMKIDPDAGRSDFTP
ncbi:MAG: DUF2066 domain-containing protein [Marinicaulis sp.]|nr:DUF2066 domain-containing protein [Marinicaulis sp.]